MTKFTFYTDPGHGWLCVPLEALTLVGLSEASFSSYSYRGNDCLYLEEDCDAPQFINEWKARGLPYEATDVYHERTFVRRLPHTCGRGSKAADDAALAKLFGRGA